MESPNTGNSSIDKTATIERWRQVKEFFQAAIELPPVERSAWLAGVCAGDSSLLAEVESLIAAHDQPGGFLDTSAVDLVGDQTDPLVGQSLGRYQIVATLGRGGMGQLYRAKDTTLGRDVAIKVLLSTFSVNQERLHRFAREARAASALNHPNIITIHEFGQENGTHFIVSEFIEGETLRQRLAKSRLSASEVLDIATQITNALEAAHKAGIFHRDIKPENIMIRPDGLVKVLDFGLAKLTEHKIGNQNINATEASTADWGRTEPGVVMGTICYMSPEQARGQELDGRTDLFSLGIVLYEMAAGRTPFTCVTAADAFASILAQEPPPIADFAADFPNSLETIIRCLLSKDREHRYQSAGELLADLKSLNSGDTASALLSAKSAARKTWFGAMKQQWRHAAITIVALAAIIAGAVYWHSNEKVVESIAVLPFSSESANSETEHLAEVITENLISNLSQLSNLTVRPRSAILRYKKREVDPMMAGRELDVEAVLTGQTTVRGEEITVSLQLVDVRNNRQLWGAKYNGRYGDLLLTEAQIAREVTENLRLRLSAGERQQLTKQPTNNLAAYQLYQQGRFFWKQRTPASYQMAIEHFKKAIDLDPSFALAYVGLADCYLLGGGRQLSVHESMSKARTAALHALKLDAQLAEAHVSLAQVQFYNDWNITEAEISFNRAIELKPDYETAHHWYALMLAMAGRFQEAIDRIKLAQTIDPVSISIIKDSGLIYFYAGQYDQAIEHCLKALEMNPNFYPAHAALGDIYLKLGRKQDAIAELVKASQLDSRLLAKTALGYGYAVTGEKKKALAVLNELRQPLPARPVPAYYLAILYTGLGQKDEAFKWLNQALQERAYRLVTLKVDPTFESLRSDPRFDDLLRQLNLAQ